MKESSATMLSGLLFLVGFPVSGKDNPPVAGETKAPCEVIKGNHDVKAERVRISIGSKTFGATLADCSTASAFMAMLPLTLNMSDLHGNEKFSDLPSRLPSNDECPGTIQTGDLMLWTSRSVVLFYKTLPTTYSYTKLGRIDNTGELSAALGTGDITIKFELE